MKLIVIILALIAAPAVYAQNTNVWAQKDSVNGSPRSAATSFVADGDGFIVTGLDLEGFKRSMKSYTNWQDDWDDEPSLGGLEGGGLGRGNASAFNVNNKGYVCLGQGETNGFFTDLWEFDPITNAWAQKADFIGSPRRHAVAFAIGDLAYVGTGYDLSGFCKDMYEYDASTNSWTQLADFGGTARQEAVGFAMGGQGYIGTGDDGVKRSDFWQYEPTTDTWTQKANFPGTARSGAVGWGVFPQAFICTGEDLNYTYTNDLWEYNYFSDAWIQRANFPAAGRSNAIAFVIDNVAYVGTGYNGTFYDDMYAYYKVLGVEELDPGKVSVYPNPASYQFTVSTDHYDLDLRLFDANGRELTESVTIQRNGTKIIVNKQGLPDGHYFIQLLNNEKQIVHSENIIFV